ncbi:hypothetical protein AwErysi_01200 [Erysipelotrichaceae bacterium]|nr:hypothetical protein AwErysi_01200 [Erysipelotrichaceae bacterium]
MDTKMKIQGFGRFLSGMVMPNIGAFIAWGLLTAIFIPTGWFPNEQLAEMVGPMITYLLPLLIAYTGGKLVAGERGGVVGAIAAIGVIVGTDMPMFLGAMVIGPLGGYLIKQFDAFFGNKIKVGFEMLVNNFSVGIIGLILAILAYFIVGPLMEGVSVALGVGVGFLVNNGLLFLTSILVEPAKVLFLNNAINHGIFSPLGLEEAAVLGKSIFFLIETNPGPGLGLLLAYCVFGKGSAKSTAPGAVIIHFFGGIHEIYFPYILMNPKLILAVIAGGMTGVLTFSLTGAGLVSSPSPGSILALAAMAPKGGLMPVLSGVFSATLVSFGIASLLLKVAPQKEEEDFAQMQAETAKQKAIAKGLAPQKQVITTIIVACDAGMGSSAMGATMLRKQLAHAGLDILVENRAIDRLDTTADLVITHASLVDRAKARIGDTKIITLTNFMDASFYETVVEELK